MPFGDRTGPLGTYPRSGRGAGWCSGFPGPGFLNPGYGSYGRGGRGWRHWFRATGLTGWQRAFCGWPAWGSWVSEPPFRAPTEEQELEVLKARASWLEKALEHLRKRIEELSGKSKTD